MTKRENRAGSATEASAPIMLLADGQTVGGYPKIATVISADLPRLAHLPPGTRVRFQPVTVTQAHQALRAERQRWQSWLASREAFLPRGTLDAGTEAVIGDFWRSEIARHDRPVHHRGLLLHFVDPQDRDLRVVDDRRGEQPAPRPGAAPCLRAKSALTTSQRAAITASARSA